MRIRGIASGILKAARNEPARRRAIAGSRKPETSPNEWFSGIDDEAWFWMNTTARRRLKTTANLVAGMPDASMQATFTGGTEDSTLREGFAAYQIFKDCYERYTGPLERCRGVLDFGCGWGRIIRFFLRDVPPEKLTGVDHSAEVIAACRDTNRWCKFTLIEPHPPTSLPRHAFDLIYLYSVFSHLPEEMHWALLKEFHQLLVPGGLLIATTRPRDFIESCKALRDDPGLQDMPKWKAVSAKAFPDAKAARAAYDSGAFCYGSFGIEGRWSFWGEACISRAYVERRWQELFEVCEYIDDRDVCAQNVIVARGRS